MSYQDALGNLMPFDWIDPYGRMPMAPDAEVSVDITVVETDDGIKATSVKNPPRSGSNRLMNVIKQVLGVDFLENGPQNGSQRSADLGKCESDSCKENDQESGKMKPSSSGGSDENRDRNPGPQGSRPGPGSFGADKTDEDAKEKAPHK